MVSRIGTEDQVEEQDLHLPGRGWIRGCARHLGENCASEARMRNNILWIILFLLGCLAGRGQGEHSLQGRLLIGLDKTGRDSSR
ncbi:MAG: hypothetical protein MZV63_55375 [Marinilabiliales bacterium]|nr:hypothetical protein [Marinilabiliales bacterium]